MGKGHIAKVSSGLPRSVEWKQLGPQVQQDRLEMVELLLRKSNRGFLVRDLHRAESGIMALGDIACTLGLNFIFYEKSGPFTEHMREWADSNYVRRDRLIGKFMKELRSTPQISGPTPMSIVANMSNEKDDFCRGFLAVMGEIECASNLLNELPLDQIPYLLRHPEGDVPSLAGVLMNFGAELEAKWNWVGAQYVYEHVNDTRGLIGDELPDIAVERVLRMAGAPEKRSPFAEALFPPMPWNYDKLSAAEQYNYEKDIIGFGLALFGGAKVAKAAMGAVVWSWNAATLAALRKFPKIGLLFGLGAAGVGAEAASENAAPQLGRTGQVVARCAGGIGSFLHASYYYTFGAIGRGVTSAAPYVVAFVRPTMDAVVMYSRSPFPWESIPAKLIADPVRLVGALLVVLGRMGQANFKPALVSWWSLNYYGDPFVSGIMNSVDDIGLTYLVDDMCEYELDWYLQVTGYEERAQYPYMSGALDWKNARTTWELSRRDPKRETIDCRK